MSGAPVVRRAASTGMVPRVRSVIEKLGHAELLERMHRIADRLAPRLRRQVHAALTRAEHRRSGASLEHALSSLLDRGDLEGAADLLIEQIDIPGIESALRDAVRSTMQSASLKWILPVGAVDLAGEANPQALAFLEDYPVPMVREMKEGVRELVRDAVQRGIADGDGPADIARLIRQLNGFGLTKSQWSWVMNYRRELMNGEPSSRALRDRRFSPVPATPEKLVTMLQRYTERTLSYRANMIARTESIRALNAGLWLTMNGIADDGHVERDNLVRRWIPAPDNATGGGPCPYCHEIAVLNENGVGMDEPFVLPDDDGSIMMPPVHPHCRCIVFTRPRLSANETFTWPRVA